MKFFKKHRKSVLERSSNTAATNAGATAVSPAMTRARLIKCMLEDMEPYGFKRHDNKKLYLDNGLVVVELKVDVIHRHMDRSSLERQAHLDFCVKIVDLPLERALDFLWVGVGDFDRSGVFDTTGRREPYIFSPVDGYDYRDSGLRKDLLDYGIDFLSFISNRDNFFDYLLCRPLQFGGHRVQSDLTRHRNRLMLALYYADRIGDQYMLSEALDKLRLYDAGSLDNRRSMTALLRSNDAAQLLQRNDMDFYRLLIK